MTKAEHLCGVGQFRPTWLQKLASAKCFLFIYSLQCTLHGMTSIYTTATLSTMEKRFKLPTSTMGLLRSGSAVSEVLLSIAIAYYGGRGSRPRWMSWGTSLGALSAYLIASLHFMYGPGREALALTEEYFDVHVYNSSTPAKPVPLTCQTNMTLIPMCDKEDAASGEYSLAPLIVIFVSQFLFGIAYATGSTLGQTYMDDHTKKKKNTPFMIGVSMSMFMVGPIVGFAFSSYFLRLYIEPTATPVITRKDPRWLGAWWLGWIVLGTMKIIMAIMLVFFPRVLPRNKMSCEVTSRHSDTQLEHSRENEPLSPTSAPSKQHCDTDTFSRSIMRILRNKVIIYNVAANTFLILGNVGYWTYLIKYTEVQYQTSASTASLLSGSTYILAMIISYLISGMVMAKFKPGARLILGWNILINILNACGVISFMFLRCEDKGVYGLNIFTGETDFLNECNSKCNCQDMKYQPVCFKERNITFFSSCHIGCQDTILDASGTKVYFSNCSCIPDVWHNASLYYSTGGHASIETYLNGTGVIIDNGPCPVDCSSMLYIFLALCFIVYVLVVSGRVGNVILNFRCVDQKDKTLAQGLSLSFLTLLGVLPAPIFSGAIIDATCVVWDSTCGPKGNCWIYDKDKFRVYFNLMGAVAIGVSALLDVKLYFLGKNINLYEDNSHSKEANGRPKEKQKISLSAGS